MDALVRPRSAQTRTARTTCSARLGDPPSLADERYALTLAVLGRSLSENSRSGRCATLYVVDGGIALETKRHLIASWDPERIRVEFVPTQFGEERELPVWGRLPPLT